MQFEKGEWDEKYSISDIRYDIHWIAFRKPCCRRIIWGDG